MISSHTPDLEKPLFNSPETNKTVLDTITKQVDALTRKVNTMNKDIKNAFRRSTFSWNETTNFGE